MSLLRSLEAGFMNQFSIGHFVLVLVLVLGAASVAIAVMTSSLLNTTNGPALVSEAPPDAKLVVQIQAIQEEDTLSAIHAQEEIVEAEKKREQRDRWMSCTIEKYAPEL
jgi:hypothetical protein